MKTFKSLVVVNSPLESTWAAVRDRLPDLVASMDDIEKVVFNMREAGIPMKKEIEGERGSKLRQTSTESAVIDVFVKDGAVTEAEDQMPWETNGQGEYIDAVNAWVQRNHPQEWELLNPDESEAGAQWDRWLRTWGHVLDAYLQAKTGRSAE